MSLISHQCWSSPCCQSQRPGTTRVTDEPAVPRSPAPGRAQHRGAGCQHGTDGLRGPSPAPPAAPRQRHPGNSLAGLPEAGAVTQPRRHCSRLRREISLGPESAEGHTCDKCARSQHSHTDSAGGGGEHRGDSGGGNKRCSLLSSCSSPPLQVQHRWECVGKAESLRASVWRGGRGPGRVQPTAPLGSPRR